MVKHAVIVAIVVIVAVAAVAAVAIGLAFNFAKTDGDTQGGLDDVDVMVHGSWSAWDPWSACSVSCGGGTQSRKRTCNRPEPMNGGRDCVGIATDQRTCSDWSCPDCSKQCPKNGVLQNCTVCECANTVITGRVMYADGNTPVPGTDVYITTQEWSPYTTTDSTGTFTLRNLCREGLKVKLRKPGFYSDKEVYDLSGGAVIFAILYEMTKPKFVVSPVSQAHIAGDSSSVTFRCEAYSNPNQITYDWFKDGNILDGYQNLSTGLLVIRDVSTTDAGRYQCRATSRAGKTFSATAMLHIQDGTNGCNSGVKTKMITLPETCEVNGARTVDVGRCEASRLCVQTDRNKETGCCGPVQSSTMSVQCETHSYPLVKITSCGCSPCLKNSTDVVISGTVYMIHVDEGRITGRTEPQSSGRIVVDGNEYDYYEYETTGKFSVPVKATSDRVVLEFRSSYSHVFNPHVVVIELIPGVTEYTTVVEILPVTETPHEVKSYERSTIPLQFSRSSKLPSAAQMTFEPDSFMNRFGNSFNGTAAIDVTYIDPRVPESLALTPVEFTYDDDEGVRRPLETYGVINVRANDIDGNKLIISKPVKLSFDSEGLGIPEKSDGSPDAMLWAINAQTGNWEELAPLRGSTGRSRRRRQVGWSYALTYLPQNVSYINLDRPFPGGFCHVAISVFEDDAAVTPAAGIKVLVYSKRSSGNSNYIGYNTGYTDENGLACVKVPCGNIHEAYAVDFLGGSTAFATQRLPSGFQFKIINNKTGIEFSSPKSSDIRSLLGPIHNADNRSCHDTPSKYSFLFKYTETVDFGTLNAVELRPERRLSWYNNKTTRAVCMISAHVLSYHPDQTKLIGTSREGTKTGDLYGTYTAPVFLAYDPEFRQYREGHYQSCVEVKCPGNQTDITTGTNYTNTVTNIDLQIFHPNRTGVCKVIQANIPGTTDRYSYTSTTPGSGSGIDTVDESNYGIAFNITHYSTQYHSMIYATGKLEEANRNAQRYCAQQYYSPNVVFDCADGKIPYMYYPSK